MVKFQARKNERNSAVAVYPSGYNVTCINFMVVSTRKTGNNKTIMILPLENMNTARHKIL